MADHLAVNKLPTCQLCRWELASGVFQAEFGSGDELILLCAQCAFARAWATWHGHMTRRLKSLKLVATLLRKGDLAELEAVRDPVPLAPTFEWSFYRAVLSGGSLFDPLTVDLGPFPTEWAALERARQLTQGLARSMEEEIPNRLGKPDHWDIQTQVVRVETSANNALPSPEEEP